MGHVNVAASLISMTALALAFGGCAIPPPLPTDEPDARISLETFDGPRLARAVIIEANRVRREHGLHNVYPLDKLNLAADDQTIHLVMITGVEHTNPLPGEHTVTDRVHRVGLDPSMVGENALMMPAESPPGYGENFYTYRIYAAVLVDGWMNSPGHRANILDPRFTFTGCSARLGRAVIANDLRVYAVQVFMGSPLDAGERPAP